MSVWSYISGTIRVEPMGRTQPEKEYILKETIEHLPMVTGSEKPMYIMINQLPGIDEWKTYDEFFRKSNLGYMLNPQTAEFPNDFQLQNVYIITLDGCLRDVYYDQAVRMFMKWVTRLAKRVDIDSILVSINTPYQGNMIFNNADYCRQLYNAELDNPVKWNDYLMWDYIHDGHGNLLAKKPEKNKEI